MKTITTNFKLDLYPSFDLERIDGEKRVYKTPEGNLYPSVTSILSDNNKQGLIEWRQRVGEKEAERISRQASSRGSRIHNILEKYVLGADDYAKREMPLNLEMFRQIKDYIDQHVDVVYGVELKLYSDQLRLAGTTDLFCRMHGERAIVDYKTSTYHKKEEWIENYFLQSAAYTIMAEERYGLVIPRFCILIATEQEGLQFFWKSTAPYKKMMINYLKDKGHI